MRASTESTPAGTRTSPWALFTAFARIGAFTFGGGYAMLPMLEREIIERRAWATHLEINDIYAMAQTIPGVIAINAAAFIGKRQAGIPGALAAVAGVIAPSFIIIILIASLLERIMGAPVVMHALSAIRAAVAGLIAAVAWRILRRTCRTPATWILAGAACALSLLPGVNAVWIILAALTGGLAHFLYNKTIRNRLDGPARAP